MSQPPTVYDPESEPKSYSGAWVFALLLSVVFVLGLLMYPPLFEEVDVIQVGARNMQNFELLKELGKLDKPILLKRGLSSTISEFLNRVWRDGSR